MKKQKTVKIPVKLALRIYIDPAEDQQIVELKELTFLREFFKDLKRVLGVKIGYPKGEDEEFNVQSDDPVLIPTVCYLINHGFQLTFYQEHPNLEVRSFESILFDLAPRDA